MHIIAENKNKGFLVRFVRDPNGIEFPYHLIQFREGGDHPIQDIGLTEEASRELGLLKDGD